MVGLSVILEEAQSHGASKKANSQVINKVTASIKSPKSPTTTSSCSPSALPTTATSFLNHCFLCKQKLLLGNDIYMYQGDRGFCSVECRSRQIFMDEEETVKRGICSLAAMRTRSVSSSTSTTTASNNPHNRQAPRTRANNGFAY